MRENIKLYEGLVKLYAKAPRFLLETEGLSFIFQSLIGSGLAYLPAICFS